MDVRHLERELRRRQRSAKTIIKRLAAKRDKLLAKLRALELEIAKHGGKAGAAMMLGRKRARNEMSLADALAKALKGKRLGIAEAMAAVQKAGYTTTSANFRTMVTITLSQDKRFKRVDRGVYTTR